MEHTGISIKTEFLTAMGQCQAVPHLTQATHETSLSDGRYNSRRNQRKKQNVWNCYNRSHWTCCCHILSLKWGRAACWWAQVAELDLTCFWDNVILLWVTCQGYSRWRVNFHGGAVTCSNPAIPVLRFSKGELPASWWQGLCTGCEYRRWHAPLAERLAPSRSA